MMNRNVKFGVALAIAALLAALAVGISATPITEKMFLAKGNIAGINVSVYQDPACNVTLTQIDWGVVAQGATVNRTIYVRNEGNVPETLSMATDAWQPIGIGNCTWNRPGAVLNANTTISATLSMTVSDTATPLSAFSFNIVITGTA